MDILSLSHEQLSSSLEDTPKYTTAQLWQWLHEKRVRSFEECTNLPKALRQKLEENFTFPKITVEHEYKSNIDKTLKYVYNCSEALIESAVLEYDTGLTACISTQAGCKMGCVFCANSPERFVRNLTTGEMLSQIYLLPAKVKHVVLMGIGEGLDNYENVVRFIRTITDEKGYNLSARNITLSTCGIVPKIDDLSAEGLPITLAISLHQTTDEARTRIMPINKRYNIKEVLDAARRYARKTGRRVSLEYAVAPGDNDTPQDAKRLAELSKGFHINLIPLNPTGTNTAQTNKKEVQKFKTRLESLGASVTLRRTLGADINAACGQLAVQAVKRV